MKTQKITIVLSLSFLFMLVFMNIGGGSGEEITERITVAGDNADIKFMSPEGITEVTITMEVVETQYRSTIWTWFLLDESGKELASDEEFGSNWVSEQVHINEKKGSIVKLRIEGESMDLNNGTYGGSLTLDVTLVFERKSILQYIGFQLTDNQFGLRNWFIFTSLATLSAIIYYARLKRSNTEQMTRKSKVIILALILPLIYTIVVTIYVFWYFSQ